MNGRSKAMLLAAMAAAFGARAEWVWMEADAPTRASFKFSSVGWGNQKVLSQEKWLFLSADADKVKDAIGEAGTLDYAFETKSAGTFEVWNRIGYEHIRTTIEWRVDDGAWRANTKDDLTTDLMALQDWCEVAWARLGEVELQGGAHTLSIRIPAPFKDQERKQPDRVIYGSDALVVATKGEFVPNGPYRPDEEFQTAEDREALSRVFALPAPAGDARAELSLAGRWGYARWNEELDVPITDDVRTKPIEKLPDLTKLWWSSVAVPGARNDSRPDQNFAHRYLCRTKFSVPEAWRGGSLYLDIERINLISSVFVNGRHVASSDAAGVAFRCDITRFVKPGEDNELIVAIKDQYYALKPDGVDDGKGGRKSGDLRTMFNLPNGFLSGVQGVSWKLEYPTATCNWSGIFNEAKLVATAGRAYADDVYCIPSVDEKKLTVAVELKGAEGARAHVSAKVQDGPAFAAQDVTLGAEGATIELVADWARPRLWSPEDPHLYELELTVEADGRRDVTRTPFGFRQWKVVGNKLCLNNVPWQMRATCDFLGCGAGEAEKAFDFWRRHGQSQFRVMFQSDWGGVSREHLFDLMDRNGMSVRAEPGHFDGEGAAYGLLDETGRTFKPRLLENWLKQVAVGMKRYRNHPCVYAWVLENEIVFINTRNFGWLDKIEPGIKECAKLVARLDRQGRPMMPEGGRALMDQSLPVNGCHYEMVDLRRYPDAAYSTDCWAKTTSWQPWPMAMDKPIFLNEEFFSPGNPVSYYAEVGGESCFLGRSACNPATSLIARMMSEGFRWQELSGWHFWMGLGNADERFFTAWQPTCALVREWNAVLPAGEKVRRTVMVRNDNTFDGSPITLRWSFGRQRGEELVEVAPGCGKIVTIELDAPKVSGRDVVPFSLACLRGGKTVFEDEKRYTVMSAAPDRDGVPRKKRVVLWGSAESSVARRLAALGAKPTCVTSFEELAAAGAYDLLLVQNGILTPQDSTDPRWAELPAAGRRVVVLEQDHPLHYQATQADIEPTDHCGSIAFPQNSRHPVFAGLETDDFRFWDATHLVYHDAFEKPTRGADSLVQCGPELRDCAMAQSTPGDGLLLATQLLVGGKLETCPVAARLFDNLVKFALSYQPLRREVAVMLADGPKARAIAEGGLNFKRAASAEEALAAAPGGVVIFDGTAANLESFRALGAKLEEFFAAGGWLMPWNVGGDDLAAFNALAGTDFILRDFRREKVEIPVPRDPLLSGLSQRDVTIFSGERIFGWVSDCFIADDVFSAVVDLDDVAPFARGFGIPGANGKRESQSVVNGFLSGEAWRYIVYQEMKDDPNGLPSFSWELAREQDVKRFSVVANGHYKGFSEVELEFETADGAKTTKGPFAFPKFANEGSPRMDFDIEPAQRAKRVTLKVRAFGNGNNQQRAVTGIDNIWIEVARSKEWRERVVPLLNVGGLVLLPRGRGGMILNQVLLKENEEVPENGPKKRNIVMTILRNLGGVFAAAKELRPGDRLAYRPLSFEGVANLYLDSARGFPSKENDLALVPCGEQKFAGVLYGVRDFRTSPLEAAATLAGTPGAKAPNELKIAAGAKADALFFLQAFHPMEAWRDARGKEPVLFVYDIVYEDGTKASFEQRYGVQVGPWITDRPPAGISGATLAWTVPAKEQGKHVQLFSAQWNNPSPEKEIREIVLRYGQHGSRFGTPVLLGVTAAKERGE